MKATIEADGEDLMVTLPQDLVDDLALKPGDEIEITSTENGVAVITLPRE